MKTARQSLGRWGENLAADFLRQRGYSIQAQNVRTPYGELDLVAYQPTAAGAVTVFVEVKTRRSSNYGFPEEAITDQKRTHLLDATQAYLQQHPELDGDWRIDVIAIRLQPGQEAEIEIVHYENAVA